MNLKDAYSILEIPQTATPEEAKKKYRELTKKYHPDINKEADAETKFKKINEAYQVVSTGKSTDREDIRQQAPHGYNPFGQQQHQVIHQAEHIEMHTTISFKDSVFGCKKDLKINRQTKCRDCNGQGRIVLNNGCTKCGGRGQIAGRQGHMIFIQTCNQCYGRSQTDDCKTCDAKGIQDAEASIVVTVPGGVQDGNILSLGGMGHYVASFGPLDQHTDVHLFIKVTPEPGLRLEGNQVVSNVEISLLEALRGCQKTVKTVVGDKKIDIKPQAKNKDEIIIPRLGVNRVGDQKVIVDVKYPQDVSKLIGILVDVVA